MSLDVSSAPIPALLQQEPRRQSPSPTPLSLPAAASRPPTILSHTAEPFIASSIILQPAQFQPPSFQPPSSDSQPATPSDDEPDSALLEALKGKDRLFVLRVAESIEALINERRLRIEITTQTSYQRLLVHRCSAYYKVAPDVDSTAKNVIVVLSSSESRVPSRRIAELVPAEAPKQPAFKIMPRRPLVRSKPQSASGSVAGGDDELSDPEPASDGSRSATKKTRTLEEREAAYNEARSRIFMDFDEKQKDNDMSASSSTFSLISGSASPSAGGSSSAGDPDDTASTAATESEFSAPPSTGQPLKKDRRGPSSSRSYRSQGSSSRNSRAASPSFAYASLYDTPSSEQYAPPGQMLHYAPPYIYAQPYPQPQGYYMYPPPPPQQQQPPIHDPTSPQQQAQTYYPGPYVWPPAPSGHPPPQAYHYPPPPAPPAPYGYAMPNGYYTPPLPPPPLQHQPPPPQQLQHYPFPIDTSSSHSGSAPSSPYTTSRPPMRFGASTPAQMNGKRRMSRGENTHAWNSYGPGIGGSGESGSGGGGGRQLVGPEQIGPRLSSRKSSSSSNNGARTPGDEASSVASSTSSGSRRTYTSTASSQQHPLPARPDWAVGLRANPTLHVSRASSVSSHHSSPARHPGRLPSATDFPPLGGRSGSDFPPLGSGTTGGGNGGGILQPPRGAWGSGRVGGVSYAQASARPGAVNTANVANGETSKAPAQVVTPQMVEAMGRLRVGEGEEHKGDGEPQG